MCQPYYIRVQDTCHIIPLNSYCFYHPDNFVHYISSDNTLKNRRQAKLIHLAVYYEKHLVVQVIMTKLQQASLLLLDAHTHTLSHLPVLLRGSKWESDWR